MALNPKKKRRTRKHRSTVKRHRASGSHKARYRRRTRKHNPARAHRRHRRSNVRAVMHHRRRRNPGAVSAVFGDFSQMVVDFGGLVIGGVGSRSIPQMVAAGINTGWLGYGLNLLTAGALAWGLSKFNSTRRLAKPALFGGFAFTAARIVDEQILHVQLVQFAQFQPGAVPMLSGDVGYGVGLAGVFKKLDFALPTDSLTAATVQAPAAAAPAALPAKTGMSGYESSYN